MIKTNREKIAAISKSLADQRQHGYDNPLTRRKDTLERSPPSSTLGESGNSVVEYQVSTRPMAEGGGGAS